MPKVEQWEYNAARITGGGPNGLVEALNKLGAEGWEAWDRDAERDSCTVFLKRRKDNPSLMNVTQVPGPELMRKIRGRG